MAGCKLLHFLIFFQVFNQVDALGDWRKTLDHHKYPTHKRPDPGQSLAVGGQVLCHGKPYKNAIVILFDTYQKKSGEADYQYSQPDGYFYVTGYRDMKMQLFVYNEDEDPYGYDYRRIELSAIPGDDKSYKSCGFVYAIQAVRRAMQPYP